MLFKEVVLSNFGIYRGTHTVDLSVSPDKPIILFGGLNGGGKTTLLDAMQLALYGKHARLSNRGQKSYSDYLVSVKNRYANAEDPVEVKLAFTHQVDQLRKTYTVTRSWNVTSQTNVKDQIYVECDGQYDPHVSNHWDDFVSEFLPQSMSDLFFFDGEKIEDLADPERSKQLIQTGIENLLGLDLITQLNIDLTALSRRRNKENVNHELINKVQDCEDEIGRVAKLLSDKKKQIATLEEEKSKAQITLNQVTSEARTAGAHLVDERESLVHDRALIKAQLGENKTAQIRLAGGVGPLGLVLDLIHDCQQQAQLEKETKEARLLHDKTLQYETDLIQYLESRCTDSTTLKAITDFSKKQHSKEIAALERECYLNVEPQIFNGLEEQIKEEQKLSSALKEKQRALEEELALIDKKLLAIPEYESITSHLSNMAEKEASFNLVAKQLNEEIDEQSRLLQAQDDLANRYSRLLSDQNKDTFEQKRHIQINENLDKLNSTLESFVYELINENIKRLELLIQGKFSQLHRKSKAITSMQICPDSFSISLNDSLGNTVSANQLSAGERQLLAISILWGLAEASGREIPTIIDTPLGRLDGKHRTNLVENYFPNASKQVILLSTDEEIVGEFYRSLETNIARKFNIEYQELMQSSSFLEGYF